MRIALHPTLIVQSIMLLLLLVIVAMQLFELVHKIKPGE